MTNEGITIVVPQTKLTPTFTRREDDSKSYCPTEGAKLSINTPFSFAFFKNTNNVDQMVCGEASSFTVFEIYKSG